MLFRHSKFAGLKTTLGRLPIWLGAAAFALNIAGCPDPAGNNQNDSNENGAIANANANGNENASSGNLNENSPADSNGNSNSVEQPMDETPPSGRALERLVASSAKEASVCYAGGVPCFVEVSVPIPDPSGGEPVLGALSFFDSYRDFYRFEEPASQLFLERFVPDADGDHLFFGQQKNGVIVFGASLGIHLKDGRVVGTIGHWLPTIPDFPELVLGADSASIIAAAEAGAPPENAEGVPMLHYFNAGLLGAGEDRTRMVWRAAARGACDSLGGCELFEYLIDAHTGEVVWHIQSSRDCSKDFDIQTANNTTTNSCWDALFETDDDDWYDEDGRVCGFLGIDCANPSPNGRAAYDLSHRTWDWYRNNFGRCGWDGDEAQLEAMVHVRMLDRNNNVISNASYNSGCDHLRFSDNMVTDDIFAHEFTHAVTRWSSGLIYANQSGALDESYADVMAAFMTDSWLIGDGCAAGTLRDMRNPPAFSDPDHMTIGIGYQNIPAGQAPNLNNDFGNVHTNSGIPNKAAFLIADGGVHNGFTIQGIGRGKAVQLYYHVLTSRLGPNSQLLDARNATIALAREWRDANRNGFTTRDVCSVINAFASVGLGSRDLDCDGRDDIEDPDDDGDFIPDSRDNCISVKNPYQEDADGDGIGDVCDVDDDNDTIADNVDNCPFRANRDQSDRDGDGVGDTCDNCPDSVLLIFDGVTGRLRRIADPDQTDSDRDGVGNICDDDDDNDGVLDAVDNCPTVRNADQRDFNGDGIGFACDAREQEAFRREEAPLPPGMLKIELCAGGCPDWFTRPWDLSINVLLSSRVNAAIVDQYGHVVTKPSFVNYGDGSNEFVFDLTPTAAARYRFPASASYGNLRGLTRDSGRAVLEPTQYYLRLQEFDANHRPIAPQAPDSLTIGALQERMVTP